MTTYADSITTLLSGDATLTAILTGGVHNYSGLGRKGLERIQTSQAFSPTTGIIKPVCIVLMLEERPDGQAFDPGSGYMSTVTPVYTYLYDNGDAGYGAIAQAQARIYTLLNAQQIPNAFQVLWAGGLRDKREPLLQDAAFYRDDWRVHGFRIS